MNPTGIVSSLAWGSIRRLLDPHRKNRYQPRKAQEALLQRLMPPPQANHFDRSYAQYRAQIAAMPILPFAVLQVVSFLMLLPLITLGLLNHSVRKTRQAQRKTGRHPNKKKSAVFLEPTEEALPLSLLNEFEIQQPSGALGLNKSDIGLIAQIFRRYPASFYFVFKVSFKLAGYRQDFDRSNCSAFICASEYSFTSSILTMWCQLNDLEHINVMHGEKLFDITNAFSTFHRFYVWHEHYLELMKKLGTKAESFIIEWPKSFEIYFKIPKTDSKTITYFLQSRDPEYLKNVALALTKFSNHARIVIRSHPRWPIDDTGLELLGGFELQDPRKISLTESITKTAAVCGSYSTALLQGYLAGRLVILDDVSDPAFFKRLEELDYALISLTSDRLSRPN